MHKGCSRPSQRWELLQRCKRICALPLLLQYEHTGASRRREARDLAADEEGPPWSPSSSSASAFSAASAANDRATATAASTAVSK